MEFIPVSRCTNDAFTNLGDYGLLKHRPVVGESMTWHNIAC